MPTRDVTAGPFTCLFFSAIFQPIFGYCCLTAGYTCAPAHTMHFSSEEVTGQDILLFKLPSLSQFIPFFFLFILKKHNDEWLSAEMAHELLPL